MRACLPLVLFLSACEIASVKLEDGYGNGGGDTGETGDTGSVVSGAIEVSPGELDLGLVFTGGSLTGTLTLTNVGNGPVDVSVALTDATKGMTVDASAASPDPGGSVVVTVTYTPVAWGDANATIVFDEPASGGHIEVPITAVAQDDADADGYGSVESGGGDCDDANGAVHPDAQDDWYDGVDSDCTGNDDYDQDRDGHASDAYGGDDCLDTDASIFAGADDAWYDGVDSDCAGNDDYDQDGDGVQLENDCNDTDSSVRPGAPDAWYDGVDSDCFGNDDYDQDGDGHASDAYGGDDCLDTNGSVYPGAPDAWYDGVDSDCLGNDDYDQDGDGYQVDNDCDDTDPTVTEPSTEVFDGADNDCDGLVDDVTIDTFAGGVVYGTQRSMGLGDKGSLDLGAHITGSARADLVAAVDYSSGYAFVVSASSLVGANGSIGDVDTATFSGSSSYYPVTYVATPTGDGDGNGRDDLLVSGWSSYGYGYSWLVNDGDVSGSVGTSDAVASFTGDSSGDQHSTAGMGDIDGDGNDDVALGTPLDNDSSSASDSGNLSIIDGGRLSGSYDIGDGTQIHGQSSYDYLGSSLAVADVTGDGYADVVIGAPGDDDGGSGAGAVYIIAGNSSMSWSSNADGASWAKLTGTSSGQAVGEDPLPLPGDVDGDGHLDVGVAVEDAGRAWVMTGAHLSAGTHSLSDAYSFSGTGGDYASAICMSSDLDGDGADELVLGGDGADLNGSNSGAVYVYRWGSWSSSMGATDADATIMGAGTNAYFGSGLGSGDDVDGDGKEDIVVGAVGVSNGSTSSTGAIYLVLGW